MDQGTRRGCRLVVRRIAVIAGALLISWGLARLCLESWSAVDRASAPTLDLLLGAVAATGACAVVGWWALVVTVVAVTSLPGRLGTGADRIARAVVPAAARHRARVALGLAATAAQVGLLVSPASAVEDLGPIGRPPVSPPSVVVPAPDVGDTGASRPAGADTSTGPPAREDDSPERRTVTVDPGDTLWTIAAEHLDDPTSAAVARSWPRWFAANRDVIGPDPDLIHPGMVLVEPTPSTDSRPRAGR